MPADSGLAFIIVLHLDPTRESGLAPLLARHTPMPVVEITDSIRTEANRVYVIAPDKSLTINGDRLCLSEPAEPRGHRHPVDVLFASLAEQRRERAIGIVLSGSGNNGSHGLNEIKANGGMTLAQNPETAQFDGMPRSAIAAGAVDHVLTIEEMPDMLLRYIRHRYISEPDGIETDAPDSKSSRLDPVLALLRVRSGHDFGSYKRATLQRRINRRMSLANVKTIPDYAELLRMNADEIKALTKDLLISVSGFFRDPEAWRTLDETVLAPLAGERAAGTEIRIWMPGCATGEEAYTLVMLAIERAEATHKQFNLKVFATDSQEANLKAAREGIYPEAALTGVSPERRRRFFDRLGGSYRVKNELREGIVFAQQNLLRDPPFSHLNLITCRNLLIYLEPEAQKKVVALFHFALEDGGNLFLGNAETIGQHDELFDTVSQKWRIYRRIGPTRHDLVDFPVFGAPPSVHHTEDPKRHEAAVPEARAAAVARRVLLERYAPASVLIDHKARILYFHGPTGDYLEPPSGEPTRDLPAMAREGLRPRLRAAVRRAIDTNRSVSFDAEVHQGGTARLVSVTVAPLAAAASSGALLLVSFETPPPKLPARARTVSPKARDRKESDAASRHVLEEELKATRAELRSTVEQMESGNEELKAANEEVTSMNEELQSSNEELETSKEELQSYNEELHTINNELHHKVQDLENLTNDQNNLLAGTEIATIFLDTDSRIRWFSPASGTLLNLMPTDVGRPLAHFAPKFADPNLLGDTRTVLEKLTRSEAEVRSTAGRWYLWRLLPYRTRDNRIVGVVLTFTDITGRKQAADAVNEERIYAQAVVETIRQPLLVLDSNLRIQSANTAFFALFKVAPEVTLNQRLYDLGNGQWNISKLRLLLEDILPKSAVVDDFVVEHDFETLGRRTMLLNARKLLRGASRPELILLAIEDITIRSAAEEHRDILIAEMSHRVKNVLATVQSIGSQTLRQSDSLEAFKTAFNGRLQALARAHDLLVDEGWAGADLGELVRRTLEPYHATGAKRATIEGPKLTLAPRVGVALIMILHELATNAAKYGALSVPHGSLEVTWWRNDENGRREIHLRWIETGGPRVKAPSRRGFGSNLIERSTAHELHGEARLDYREEGLHGELIFPGEEGPVDLT